MKTDKQQYKSSGCMRPYVVNKYKIGSIIFYSKGKEVFNINQGWIEDNNIDIKSIWLNEVKRANKLNLDRKDNFTIFMYNPHKDYMREKETILYINVDSEDLLISEDKFKFYCENDTEKTYKVSKIIKGLVYTRNEYIKKDGVFNWETVINSEPIEHVHSHKDELKPFGEVVLKAVALLKDNKIEVSKYDVEKIINRYNIIKHIVEEVV